MTKTKRQLRAEAVERLKQLPPMKMTGNQFVNAIVGPTALMTEQDINRALIDLLTDDELPEGDALEIMRNCSAMEHGMGTLRDRLGIECVAGWQMRCLRALADMVERDYVRRELYYERVKELGAERDEWKAKAEKQAEGSSKVRAGSSNLEWLYEHDEFFSRFARWYVVDGEKADDDIQADRWLMEHVDERPASSSSLNETANETATDVDTREKLEAEIRYEYSGPIKHEADRIIEWLDRQAVITERELGHVRESWARRVDDQSAEIGKLTEQLEASHVKAERLKEQVDGLKADLEVAEAEEDRLRSEVAYLESRHCEWSDPNDLGDGCMLRHDELVDRLRAERDEMASKLNDAIDVLRR